MKKLIFIFIVLVVSVAVWATDFSVDYVDGSLMLRNENSWSEVYIGDIIPDNAILKLGEDSIAELRGDELSFTLSRPGIYNLADVVKQRGKMRSWGVVSVLGNKISGVLSEKKIKNTAVMGVRGAKADDSKDVEWVEDSDDYVIEGKQLLKEGKYDEAIEVLKEGMDEADDDVRNECLYLLGVADIQRGKYPSALKYLNKVKPDPYSPYFDNYIVLRGNLLVDSFSFEEANRLFDLYLKNRSSDDNLQVVYYLKAVALRNLNRDREAKGALKRAYQMDPSSEIGKRSRKLLSSF